MKNILDILTGTPPDEQLPCIKCGSLIFRPKGTPPANVVCSDCMTGNSACSDGISNSRVTPSEKQILLIDAQRSIAGLPDRSPPNIPSKVAFFISGLIFFFLFGGGWAGCIAFILGGGILAIIIELVVNGLLASGSAVARGALGMDSIPCRSWCIPPVSQVSARLIEIDDKYIVIQEQNGNEIHVDISNLSEEDAQYILEVQSKIAANSPNNEISAQIQPDNIDGQSS